MFVGREIREESLNSKHNQTRALCIHCRSSPYNAAEMPTHTCLQQLCTHGLPDTAMVHGNDEGFADLTVLRAAFMPANTVGPDDLTYCLRN